MRNRPAIRRQWQKVGMLLAMVCLWMSSGATLRHTDDLGAYRDYSVHQSRLSATVGTDLPDNCVAHEWMNAWHHGQTSAWRILYTPVYEIVAALVKFSSPTLRFAVTEPLRGPPSA